MSLNTGRHARGQVVGKGMLCSLVPSSRHATASERERAADMRVGRHATWLCHAML